MFERLILQLIHIFETATEELKRAYFETYGDKELATEFNSEVERRREYNKDLFIKRAAGLIGKKVLDEEGYILPPQQAMHIGEVLFYSAKNIGKIDDLNNTIE